MQLWLHFLAPVSLDGSIRKWASIRGADCKGALFMCDYSEFTGTLGGYCGNLLDQAQARIEDPDLI